MGIIGSRNEEELSETIQEDYQKQSNQFLIHKKSQLPCTLHKITTTSSSQSSSVVKNIQEYKNSQCRSISKLKEHHHINNGGYCSDQQNFYLIFEGQNTPTIKQQYLARRYNGKSFSSSEIENILAVMLCGLREYSKRFNRGDSRISLQTVGIDILNKNHMYLKDPWLSEKEGESSQSVNFITSYPSPQKLHAVSSFSSIFDEFKSDLFTIGMLGLELGSMNFKDEIYLTKKFIDRNRLNEQLSLVKDGKVRSGLQILLSENPHERENIYNFWNIRCENEYYLPYREGEPQRVSNEKANMYKELTTDRTAATQNIEMRKNSDSIQRKRINSVNTVSSSQNQMSLNRNYYPQPNTINMSQISNGTMGSGNMINQGKVNINMNIPTMPAARYRGQQVAKGQEKINKFKKEVGESIKKTDRVASLENKANISFTNQNVSTHKNVNKSLNAQKRVNVNTNNNVNTHVNMNVNMNKPVSTNTMNINTITKNYEVKNEYKTPNFDYRSATFKVESDHNKKYQVNFNKNQQPITNSFSVNSVNSSVQMKNDKNTQLVKPNPNYHNVFTDFSKIGLERPIEYEKREEILKKGSIKDDTTQSFGNPSLITAYQSESLKTSIEYQNIFPNPNQVTEKEEMKYVEKKEFLMNQPQDDTVVFHNEIQNKKSEQQIVQQIEPESPSTIEVTPPPHQRHPNKYNSTIVQVNEETPNDSENSQDESPQQMEFVVQEYETGSKYEGYKKNNVRNGRGKFFYQDGGYYDGEWKNNQMHGWGKLFYEGGKLAYEGNWAHDEFHGYGKVYNDNPIPIPSSSGFDYTNFDLLDDYWQHYEGMLVTDTKQGRGRIQLTNGQIFEGDFHNDRIQGFGKFTKLDGTLTQGIWRDSRLIKVLNSN